MSLVTPQGSSMAAETLRESHGGQASHGGPDRRLRSRLCEGDAGQAASSPAQRCQHPRHGPTALPSATGNLTVACGHAKMGALI